MYRREKTLQRKVSRLLRTYPVHSLYIMKSVPFILLFWAAAGIGISTFVEDAHGTPFIQTYVYGTWWFKLLWTAVVVTSAALFVRRKMWKNFPLLVLHLSFGVIFAGALTTAFTGHKGILHLRKDQPTGEYVNERKQVARLPFMMRLDSFRIAYYPGTEAPADYVSQISCQHIDGDIFARPIVSMNRIFSAQGYRFYQSSYDEDLEGSWLSVNYDPWGTGITYAGFCLMGLGCLLLLCARDGGFRRLLRHPLIRKGGLFLIALFGGCQLKADPALPVVKRVQADSLAIQQVVYNDRVAPFNTLARDFIQKIYGRPSFHGITPEQVVSSWMLYPEEWNRTPIIRIKNQELRTALGLKEEYASLNHLFDGTQYKLQPLWQREQGNRSKLAQAIQETDEKVGLILMLRQGTLVRPLPPDVPHLSTQKVNAELWYNRIPFSKILFMVNLTLGFAAFGLFMFRMLTGRKEKAVSRRVWGTALCLTTLFHATGYALRGYIRGGFPLSNGYETMQFVALAVLLTACLLQRRFPAFRFPAFRIHSARGLLGRDEPANYAPHAGIGIPMAELARVAHHDFIRPFCFHLSERHPGLVSYRETKKHGFADYRRTNRTTHLVEPSSVISGHFPVGHRHCVGSRMGQRVVGQLLVVGPERSVGTCGVHHLRHLFPPEKPALFSTSMAIPWLYDPRFRRSPDDLLRSQLSARWHAQLCQFLTKSLLSGIAQAGFCK